MKMSIKTGEPLFHLLFTGLNWPTGVVLRTKSLSLSSMLIVDSVLPKYLLRFRV